jgi:hypothetical protein
MASDNLTELAGVVTHTANDPTVELDGKDRPAAGLPDYSTQTNRSEPPTQASKALLFRGLSPALASSFLPWTRKEGVEWPRNGVKFGA